MRLVTPIQAVDYAFERAADLHHEGRHTDAAHVLNTLTALAAWSSVHSAPKVLPFRITEESDEEYRARFDEALGLNGDGAAG